MTAIPALVSTKWLAERLGSDDIAIADTSWYLPSAGRNPRKEYEAAHIPSAVFFDIDEISDQNTMLPHMLPDAANFERAIRKLGIRNSQTVVFYDTAGIFSSPRAWWMLRAMGHTNCAVLDGGFPKWQREGLPVESKQVTPKESDFHARPDRSLVRDYDEVHANISAKAAQLLDARSPARFRGDEPEPRPGLKSGHIPGSCNVYYADLLAPDGTMRDVDSLKTLFHARALDLNKPIVTSCGSGITAAVVFLASEVAGAKDVALYDGSWAEWGSRPGAPIERG